MGNRLMLLASRDNGETWSESAYQSRERALEAAWYIRINESGLTNLVLHEYGVTGVWGEEL